MTRTTIDRRQIVVANVATIDEDGCPTSAQLWPELGEIDGAIRMKAVVAVQRWAASTWHKRLTARCPVVICFVRLDDSRDTVITTVGEVGSLLHPDRR